MDADILEVGNGVVDGGVVADELVGRRHAAGRLAHVARGVHNANLELDAGLIDDVLEVPLLGDDTAADRGGLCADVVGRAGVKRADDFPPTRPTVVAVAALPVTVLAIVVNVVAVVVGVELDVGRAGANLSRQCQLVIVDQQFATVVGRFGDVVIERRNRQQLAVGRGHVVADQRVGLVIVEPDADVVDVVEAVLAPEGERVDTLDKGGERNLADPRRAAPFVANVGGVNG